MIVLATFEKWPWRELLGQEDLRNAFWPSVGDLVQPECFLQKRLTFEVQKSAVLEHFHLIIKEFESQIDKLLLWGVKTIFKFL